MASGTAIWWSEFSTFWLRHPVRRLGLIALACLLSLSIFATQHFRVEKELASPHKALGLSAETVYLPPVEVLRLASLGHQSFVADVLFVRVAHYFVDHLLTDSQLPFIDLYLDAIWGLDAHNKTTYHWGAQVIKFGQRIDEDVNRRANRFSRLGIEAFPLDGWLYHEIAYNLFAYKHLYDEIESTRREKLALAYMGLAYKMPGFDFDPNYLATLYERAGNIDDAVSTALGAYALGTAEQRRELRLRLQEKDREGAAAQLAWLDRFRRRDWVWLSEPLAVMVGPRRLSVPPQDAARPENWLAEPPTPAWIIEELDLQKVEPIGELMDPGARRDAAEWHPPDGSPFAAAVRLPLAATEPEARAGGAVANQDETGAAPLPPHQMGQRQAPTKEQP
ncbi:MAG: hypothetical protein H6747_10645 [Deltaproteobacteria bacterium]|nr:hypothetical protein [Deltaproteobacteria bacterium]